MSDGNDDVEVDRLCFNNTLEWGPTRVYIQFVLKDGTIEYHKIYEDDNWEKEFGNDKSEREC